MAEHVNPADPAAVGGLAPFRGAIPARPPPPLQTGAIRWARENLFSDWLSTLITFGCAWLAYIVLSAFIQWGAVDAVWTINAADKSKSCVTAEGNSIDGACWSFIRDTWDLFIVGTYPTEQRWRPYLALGLVFVLAGMVFVPPVRSTRTYRWLCILLPLPLLLLISGWEGSPLARVGTNLWGGLLVTMVLSIGGIAVSFPFSILLALGRRNKTMPVIRAICVGYIEMIRGVPLITILFMAFVLIPLFFPRELNINQLMRAQIGVVLFSAAYLAEVIRGGLQGVPSSQEEAASALGLSYWQTMRLIIMPQALRIVIPPLVSTFIGLLKDTSLVVIIGLFDLLGAAGLASSNPNWLGKIIEGYVFIALIYWVICFGMSRYSIHLERRLGVKAH